MWASGFAVCSSLTWSLLTLVPWALRALVMQASPMGKFAEVRSNISRFWHGEPFCRCGFFQVQRFHLSMSIFYLGMEKCQENPLEPRSRGTSPNSRRIEWCSFPPKNISLNRICHKNLKKFLCVWSSHNILCSDVLLAWDGWRAAKSCLSIRAHMAIATPILRNWNVKLDIYFQS